MSVALLEWPPGQIDRCLELWDERVFPGLQAMPGYQQARLLLRGRSVPGGSGDAAPLPPAQLALIIECDTPEQQFECLLRCVPQAWIVGLVPASAAAGDNQPAAVSLLPAPPSPPPRAPLLPPPPLPQPGTVGGNLEMRPGKPEHLKPELAEHQRRHIQEAEAEDSRESKDDGDFDLELCLELLERGSPAIPEAQQFLAELEEIWRLVDPELAGEVSGAAFDKPALADVLRAVDARFDSTSLRRAVVQISGANGAAEEHGSLRITFWELARRLRAHFHPGLAEPELASPPWPHAVWARPRRHRPARGVAHTPPRERRVRLRFFARNLPVAIAEEPPAAHRNPAGFAGAAAVDLLPNPVLAVFVRDSSSAAKWDKAGCTEVIRSTSHPVWGQPVELVFRPGLDFDLKFAVYDMVDYPQPPPAQVQPEFEDLIGETPMASLYAVLQEDRLELPLYFQQQLQGLGVEESIVSVTHEAALDYTGCCDPEALAAHPLLQHEISAAQHRRLGEESARQARARFISSVRHLPPKP